MSTSFLPELTRALKAVKVGNSWTACCPAHDDKNPSLSINLSSNDQILLHCHAGCSQEQVIDSLKNRGLWGSRENSEAIETNYVYFSPDEERRLRVTRTDHPNGKKNFYQSHWTGTDWKLGKGEGPIAPYNHALWKNDEGIIFLAEGEKCAEELCKHGLAGTAIPGGAAGWKPAFGFYFAGKEVRILPDNDKPGLQFAKNAFNDIKKLAKSVGIVSLPELREGEDIVDWFAKGNSKDTLLSLGIDIPSNLENTLKANTGINFVSLSNLYSQPIPDTEYLVEDLLPTAGLSIIAAKPKVGKSTLARNLALSVARGSAFLGKTTQKGVVLYIALEEKQSEVVKHFQKMGATAEESILIHVGIAPREGALREIEEAIKHHGAKLVIIDPLFKLIRIKNGNDYNEVSSGLEELLDIARRTGAHILTAHHLNKGDSSGTDNILGSTAIFGAVDCAIIMSIKGKQRVIQTTQRYGADFPESVISMEVTTGAVSIIGTSGEAKSQTVRESILGLIKAEGRSVTQVDLLEKVSGTRNETKLEVLAELVSEGLIAREGNGRSGNALRYRTKTEIPHSQPICGEAGRISV